MLHIIGLFVVLKCCDAPWWDSNVVVTAFFKGLKRVVEGDEENTNPNQSVSWNLLPKERSFGKQKKKKEINEIDLNYELGYNYHHHTKLVKPNYNWEAWNLCFWHQKGGVMWGVFSLGLPLSTENKLMSKDLSWPLQDFVETKENTAVRAAKSPCDQTPLMMIQPNFVRWVTPSSHPWTLKYISINFCHHMWLQFYGNPFA